MSTTRRLAAILAADVAGYKAVDIKQVGRELGVRYVLEGSVRKAGGRLRITGQLIEAATVLICGPTSLIVPLRVSLSYRTRLPR